MLYFRVIVFYIIHKVITKFSTSSVFFFDQNYSLVLIFTAFGIFCKDAVLLFLEILQCDYDIFKRICD